MLPTVKLKTERQLPLKNSETDFASHEGTEDTKTRGLDTSTKTLLVLARFVFDKLLARCASFKLMTHHRTKSRIEKYATVLTLTIQWTFFWNLHPGLNKKYLEESQVHRELWEEPYYLFFCLVECRKGYSDRKDAQYFPCHRCHRQNLRYTCYNPRQTRHNPRQTCYNPRQTCYNPRQTCYNPRQTCYNQRQTCYNQRQTRHNLRQPRP